MEATRIGGGLRSENDGSSSIIIPDPEGPVIS
jgi:hypothetical protein